MISTGGTTQLGLYEFRGKVEETISNFNDEKDQILDDFQDTIDIAAAAGAGANGWTDLLVQTWSGRTQEDKNKDVVHAEDYSFTGIGDESTKLKNLFSNNIVVLQKDAVYSFNETINLQNIIIFANNATLSLLTNISDWAIKFNANVQIIGKLNIEVPDGFGARVYGNNFKVDELEVISISPSQNFGFQVQTANTSAYVENCNIGKVTTKNFVSQQQIFRVKNSWFGSLICENYRTGVYFRDLKNVQVAYIEAKQMFPDSVGSAGSNGLLCESTIDNHSMTNVTVHKVHVEDSPEHGVRFGGQYTISDFHFGSIYTKNTGAGVSRTGGSGFKILGGNQARPLFNYHENITVGSIVSEDCCVSAGVNNFAALTISHAKGVTVGSHIVRKVNNATYSCFRGLHLACCSDINILSQDYKDTNINGVMFYNGEQPDMEAYDYIERINLPNYNCKSISTNSASIYFNASYTKIADITINGTLTQDIYVRAETQTGTGSTTAVKITIKAKPFSADTTGKVPPLLMPNTANGFVVNVTSKWFGTYGSSCSDGSVFIDPTTSPNFRYRSGGTWRVPTLS